MSTITRISPQEASAKMAEGYVYVDVRSEAEFEEGRPQGSVNVPIAHQVGGGMAPNGDFVAVMKACFALDAKIILGCRSGHRSMRAAEALIREGYTQLLEQRAGWDGARDPFGQMAEAGWARAGLPVESGAGGAGAYGELKKKVR